MSRPTQVNRAVAMLRLTFALFATAQSLMAQTVVFDLLDQPYVFELSTWKKGLPEWPSHNFMVPKNLEDWSGYDRLVLEFYNREGTDPVCCYISASDGRLQDGLKTSNFYPDPGVYHQWTISLDEWPKTMDQHRVGRIHVFYSRPHETKAEYFRAVLLKPGEDLPAVPLRFNGSQDIHKQQKRRRKVLAEFIGRCRDEGQDGRPFFLGQASSVEKVRPRAPEKSVCPATNLTIRLARNEYESVQLLVLPKTDLQKVGVRVSNLLHEDGDSVLSASNVQVAVMGYVKTEFRPSYCVARNRSCVSNELGFVRERVDPEIGWWPDPILGWLNEIDVKAYDLQSFWIRVYAPDSMKKGLYRGRVAVLVNGRDVMSVPLQVTVYGFRIPDGSPLDSAITFAPYPFSEGRLTQSEMARLKRLAGDPLSPVNQWGRHRENWADFLYSYHIPFDNLYRKGSPDWAVLKRQKAKGKLRGFQLGFWSPPVDLGDTAKSEWKNKTIVRMRKTWQEAVANKLESYAYIYGCDELPKDRFDCAKWAVQELRREFPGVKILTTAYDRKYGVDSPLSAIDKFVPLTSRFDAEKADMARKDGRKVWWYVCCGPKAPYANMFIEGDGIEPRIIMGAQTVKYRPDGFLYYQTAIWNSERPISGVSAFTDWNPRSWRSYHGDGSWVCCGPGGQPVATVRLENFRDGLEDYAYALLLEKMLNEHTDKNNDWSIRARKLLAVPREVMDSMMKFTDNPDVLYRWRDSMAAMIEEMQTDDSRMN